MQLSPEVGCTFAADLDIIVDGCRLLAESQIAPRPPRQHLQISTPQQLAQQFAFSVEKGQTGEKLVAEDLFAHLVGLAKRIGRQSLGGTAVTMARRLDKEGVPVLLGTEITEQLLGQCFARTRAVHVVEQLSDVHLALEFWEGDAFGEVRAKKSSRLYLNHDKASAAFSWMDLFFEQAIRCRMIVLGGVQLLSFRQNKGDLLQRLSARLSKCHSLVHLQLSDQGDAQLGQLTKLHLMPFVDSLGATPEEIRAFLGHGPDDLSLMCREASRFGRISRIHVHGLEHTLVCRGPWKGGAAAVQRGLQVVRQILCGESGKIEVERRCLEGWDVFVGKGGLMKGGQSTVGLGDQISAGALARQLAEM